MLGKKFNTNFQHKLNSIAKVSTNILFCANRDKKLLFQRVLTLTKFLFVLLTFHAKIGFSFVFLFLLIDTEIGILY